MIITNETTILFQLAQQGGILLGSNFYPVQGAASDLFIEVIDGTLPVTYYGIPFFSSSVIPVDLRNSSAIFDGVYQEGNRLIILIYLTPDEPTNYESIFKGTIIKLQSEELENQKIADIKSKLNINSIDSNIVKDKLTNGFNLEDLYKLGVTSKGAIKFLARKMPRSYRNVSGSSPDPKISGNNWIKTYRRALGHSDTTRYKCSTLQCSNDGIYGGHVVFNKNITPKSGSNSVRLIPICPGCNNTIFNGMDRPMKKNILVVKLLGYQEKKLSNDLNDNYYEEILKSKNGNEYKIGYKQSDFKNKEEFENSLKEFNAPSDNLQFFPVSWDPSNDEMTSPNFTSDEAKKLGIENGWVEDGGIFFKYRLYFTRTLSKNFSFMDATGDVYGKNKNKAAYIDYNSTNPEIIGVAENKPK